MKAALTALVLIVGAAVVLWFGNTLNSWIVGGLIGGLAALLISIPISLLIFSHLSRRHDEHLRAIAQEEMTLAQEHAYRPRSYMQSHVQMIDVYPPMLEGAADERVTTSRRSSMQAMPEESAYDPREQRAASAASTKLPIARRGTYLPEVVQQPKASSATKRRTTRNMNYPGFPGYQPGSSFSQLQAAALRTARLEAAQQYDDIDFMPTNTGRRRAAMPQESFTDYEAEMRQAQDSEHMRAVREQTSQQQAVRRANQPRPQHVIESAPSRATTNQATPSAEPQTDYQQGTPGTSGTPHTEPMRQHRRLPQQTGQLGRHPRLDALPADPERETDTTGTARHTLLRRAPYTYEDDEVRQQYAQQLSDTPPVRRSSRFSSRSLQQEDEE